MYGQDYKRPAKRTSSLGQFTVCPSSHLKARAMNILRLSLWSQISIEECRYVYNKSCLIVPHHLITHRVPACPTKSFGTLAPAAADHNCDSVLLKTYADSPSPQSPSKQVAVKSVGPLSVVYAILSPSPSYTPSQIPYGSVTWCRR